MNRSLARRQGTKQTYEEIRSQHKILKMIPFNSDTKKMTVVIETEPGKRVRVYTKGASENIIDDCAKMIEKSQQPGQPSNEIDLDLSIRERLKDGVLKQMA